MVLARKFKEEPPMYAILTAVITPEQAAVLVNDDGKTVRLNGSLYVIGLRGSLGVAASGDDAPRV
jgi:hypothetical protein